MAVVLLLNTEVRNCQIKGNSSNSINVGGIAGRGHHINFAKVKNSNITSKGSNVGGITGIYRNYRICKFYR